MQPRPSFNPELLILLAVGIVAILGVGWIFLTNDRSETPIPPTIEPTVLPSKVSLLETEALPRSPSATPTREEATPTPTATRTSLASYPGPPGETPPSASTPITESQLPPLTTPDANQAPPLPIGKHDNTDPNITYDRFWTFEMNSGTKFAYKGTLHISPGIGSKASFRFTGQRLYFGYQRGRNFGIVTVIIDDQTYSFHEQAVGNVWRSPELAPGTHSVTIIHESGQTINLDYIEIWGQS